ncbi:MAG TPA: hypothetical protein VNW46_10585 [Gemmatimonadaceae bacterium]|nr:hypothetical protein [Gemmatimonadaceae bacterium]
MRCWHMVVAVALVSAPWLTAGAQQAPKDTTTSSRPQQRPRVDAKRRRSLIVFDTSLYRPAPNAGRGIGFTSGAISPSVGMTGSNDNLNNSSGRTATPAQGSSGSPEP